jgi:hypothetical protein
MPDTPLTRGIVKNRHIFWIVLAVFYLLAFNGQWRVGRVFELYSGLCDSLATGNGYTFVVFGSRRVHPGLPVVLATFQKCFGRSDLPPILFMNAVALGCLIVTYKLVELRFPPWVAVIVTFAVGINGWFMELAQEMLADLPFLLGMLAALYGWERLRVALALDGSSPPTQASPPPAGPPRRGSIVSPLIYVVAGLVLAAVMRPTFWILALAWVMVCAWGVVTSPRRRFYAIGLLLPVIAWILVALVAASVRGARPAGGYEHDALAAIRKIVTTLPENLWRMLRAELAYAFFGQKWVPGMTELMNVIAVAAGALLWKRNPLWTLLILLTVAVTLVMGPVPRYYVMILPLMALSWVVLSVEVARRVPHRWLEVALAAGIAMLVIPNVVRCCKVIGEQRGWNNKDAGPKWGDVMAMSRHVSELVPPGEKVIAPGASIMSYLSGRTVVNERDILPTNKRETLWPAHLAALDIHYAVFPSQHYRKAERRIRELMDKQVIVPTERVAREGEMALMKIRIDVPPAGQDWRKRPVTATPIGVNTTVSGENRAVVKARRTKQAAAHRKAVAARKAEQLARQKKVERQQRRQAAARAAAAAARKRHAKLKARNKATTQPAATTTTQPAAGRSELPAHYFDVGGFSGQSVASRSASICSRVNFRDPWLIPWQRFPAASQFFLLERSPSQNGQVRHCSGRASYTEQTFFTCPPAPPPLPLPLPRGSFTS